LLPVIWYLLFCPLLPLLPVTCYFLIPLIVGKKNAVDQAFYLYYYTDMKNIFKLFGIFALVTIIGFSFASCDYNPDEDGDGSFYMYGEANSFDSYDYRFLNQSNYKVTVTIGYKKLKLQPLSFFGTVITHYRSRTMIKYSPTDKVIVNGGGPTVYFRDR